MKKTFLTIAACLVFAFGGNAKSSAEIAEQNVIKAMNLLDNAVNVHFKDKDMAMARFYNPYTEVSSDETGSVWMYTAAIESVNSVLHALKTLKNAGYELLYNDHFHQYTDLLAKLYDNLDYYMGTFTLVSYTQTKEWSVYGVHRSASKGTAKVEGVENVYDDQMWLVRELVESYKITGNAAYLQKAEYLTEYVLDGWDCVRDSNGEEYGGIPWGPGYVTKHSCSNGPMVSPLVWLSELYNDKNDEIEYRYIDTDGKTRVSKQVKKSDYYLKFAEKVYNWQKKYLLNPNTGVYDDMMGGCSLRGPRTEIIDGVEYRRGTFCRDRVGETYTYNSGTMLSGAVDLYRATNNNEYLEDAKKLSDASFSHFAKLGVTQPDYYTFDTRDFRNWFNGVLMRAYVEVYPVYKTADKYINSFQQNLDYGYTNHLYKNILPTDLLIGWRGNRNTEGMFSFTFAAEYAKLAQHILEKDSN